MFLLQLKSDLSVTPRHRMMKTCQEPLSKKTPPCPVAASRLTKRESFKLEAGTQLFPPAALTWKLSRFDHPTECQVQLPDLE